MFTYHLLLTVVIETGTEKIRYFHVLGIERITQMPETYYFQHEADKPKV